MSSTVHATGMLRRWYRMVLAHQRTPRAKHGGIAMRPLAAPTAVIESLEQRMLLSTVHVTSVTPSAPMITDAQAGIGGFVYAVTFNEAMKTTATPTIAFSPVLASTSLTRLTYRDPSGKYIWPRFVADPQDFEVRS